VFLPLPVGLADAGERLAAVKREMDALNRSPAEGAVAYALLAGGGRSLPSSRSSSSTGWRRAPAPC
jgi:hypothetical protein